MHIPVESRTPVASMVPVGVELAIERTDDVDLDRRAAAMGIIPYCDSLHPRRRCDFLAGRLAARATLQRMNAAQLAVGRDDQTPVWPKGYCGSISHSAGVAVAITAHSPPWRALGIDIEARIDAKRIRAMRFALTADELLACERDDNPWAWTRAWAAKEAAFKCSAALGANPGMRDLVPEWVDAQCGAVSVPVDHALVRIELVSCVADELMWVIASVREDTAIRC